MAETSGCGAANKISTFLRSSTTFTYFVWLLFTRFNSPFNGVTTILTRFKPTDFGLISKFTRFQSDVDATDQITRPTSSSPTKHRTITDSPANLTARMLDSTANELPKKTSSLQSNPPTNASILGDVFPAPTAMIGVCGGSDPANGSNPSLIIPSVIITIPPNGAVTNLAVAWRITADKLLLNLSLFDTESPEKTSWANPKR